MKIPKLAMFNDISGYGHCSTTVSLPVISAMQVQVCPVPTAVLSNHLGFPVCHATDYTPHMRKYLKAWKELGLSFDGLYCGYLGTIEQIEIVKEFLDEFRPGFFLLDPVMADHGKCYASVTDSYCESMRGLIARADLITPNVTEACLLTDTPYKDNSWTDYELLDICKKLSAICDADIVVTGLSRNNQFINYIWQAGIRYTYTTQKEGQSRPGSGDLFASILAADALHHVKLETSVQKASEFVAKCIAESEKAQIPLCDGIMFEPYLMELAKLGL